MLRPLAMQHVSLWLVREDASAASIALAESGVFNPDAADGFRLQLPDVAEQRFREVYLAARSRLDKILAHFGRAALPPLHDELLVFRKESVDSPRRLNAARALRGIVERGALGADSARPDMRAQKIIDSLFSLPLEVAGSSGPAFSFTPCAP